MGVCTKTPRKEWTVSAQDFTKDMFVEYYQRAHYLWFSNGMVDDDPVDGVQKLPKVYNIFSPRTDAERRITTTSGRCRWTVRGVWGRAALQGISAGPMG